ncbi:MAG: septation protein SepH [Actinomycetes bacterium]
MTNLKFIGLSANGSQLLLADSGGKKFNVTIDVRLRAILRGGESAPGQMEIALNTLGPREIQARIRAGASVAELAEESGVEVERIERYAGPPLAERDFMASQARDTHLTSHLGDRGLLVVVASAAESDGVPSDAIRWDSWQREDGTWHVLSAYPVNGSDRVATWIFHPRERWVTADDAEAAAMLTGPLPVHVLAPVPDADDEKPKPVRRTRKKITADDSQAPVEPAPSEPESATDPAPASAADPEPRKSKRASVPTWDEILFGGATPES